MVDLIHKVRQERVPGAKVEHKILYPDNRDHVDLRLAARRAMIFGSLNPCMFDRKRTGGELD
jgi:hypothetical protein